MFCPNCGTQISNESKFCMNCGKPINFAQHQSPTQQAVYQTSVRQTANQVPVQRQTPFKANYAPQPTQPPIPIGNVSLPKSRSLAWLWISLITILIGAIIFVGINFFKSDEQKIRERLDDFSEACNDGDIEEMIECFDKKTRKYYETSIDLAESLFSGITGFDLPLGDTAGLIGLQDLGVQINIEFVVEEIIIEGDTATVTVTMTELGTSETDEVKMCKEDDDWYIDFEDTTGQSLSLY